MKLTIIGSGTMMPTKTRHPACYLLEIANQKILLDLGHNSIARLVDLGIDLHSIDAVFISHFHTDHFGDLLPFIHARWVDDMYQNQRKHKPLTIIGPKSLEARFKKLREVFWVEPKEHYPLKFIEGVQSIKLGKIQIELFEVQHVKYFQSLGIKITHENKSLVYTGDIGSNHSIEELKLTTQNTDLLLIEAGSTKPTPNHFTIEQIIEVVKDAQVKKAVATHIRDTHLPILKKKTKNHDNIILAEDLMKIKI